MAGTLDVLRLLGGAQQQGQSPAVKLPGFDEKAAKSLEAARKKLVEINKLVKQGRANWRDYSDVRSLVKATRALSDLSLKQKEFDRALKTGNLTLRQRADAYAKLADAHRDARKRVKEANFELNESRGVLGRLKNTLDDVAEHKWAILMGAAVHDLNIVLGDMHNQFKRMASGGQTAGASMSDLAKATGTFTWEMRTSMLTAAKFGITADESNQAFAKLTTTYGANAEAVKMLGNNWENIAVISQTTGLGLTDFANLADTAYRRLGESIETSMQNAVNMSNEVTNLNRRFGAGSITVQEFNRAVIDLAHSQGFYNQNTRLVIESLSREINMQMALGRSREAATKRAVENLQAVGKVNIAGINKFRQDILSQYRQRGDDFLEELRKDFGQEGQVIAGMIESGRLSTDRGLLVFENLVKNSSKLSADMLDNFRTLAMRSPETLAGMGIDLQRALLMQEEALQTVAKLQNVARAEGTDAQEAALRQLFGGAKADISDAEISAFTEKLQKGMSKEQMLSEFYRLGGVGAPAEITEAGVGAAEQPWEQYVKDREGQGWFQGMTGSIRTIVSLLGELPTTFATTLLTLFVGRGILSRVLGNLPMPGMGGAAAVLRGGGGFLAGAGGVASSLGAAAKIIGPLAVIGDQVFAWASGMYRASEILGKSDVTLLERVAAGAANAVSHLTFGMVSASKLARGETLLQRAYYESTFGLLEKGLKVAGIGGFGDVDATGSDAQLKAQYEHAKKMGWLRGDESLEEYKARIAQPTSPGQAMMQQAAAAASETEMATPNTRSPDAVPRGGAKEPSGGAAKAKGFMQGSSLILEVVNWEDVFAETQYANESAHS